LIANPVIIADLLAPEAGGGNNHKHHQNPSSVLSGETFGCLLGLLIAEQPALPGGEAVAEPSALASGEMPAEQPTLAGGCHKASWSPAAQEAPPREAPPQENGVVITCASEALTQQSSSRRIHYCRSASETGESRGTPSEIPDVPTRLGLTPAAQAVATVMQAQPPTLGETTSAAGQTGYDVSGFTAGSDHDTGTDEAVMGIPLSGAQPPTDPARFVMGTGMVRSIQWTEMPSARVIGGPEPMADGGLSDAGLDPVMPQPGARAAAGATAMTEEMYGRALPPVRGLRVGLAESTDLSFPLSDNVRPMPPAGGKARPVDGLIWHPALSQQSEVRSTSISMTSPSCGGAGSSVGEETLHMTLRAYPETVNTPRMIASDVREDSPTTTHRPQSATESESAEAGGNRTAAGGGQAGGQGSETSWIDSLLAGSARHQGQRATAVQQRPAERTDRSGVGSPEVAVTVFQGKASAAGGNSTWSSNATGSDDSVQQSMISEMIDRVTAARAGRTPEANFEIETEAGDTIRVRIALNGRILTGRIGVADHDTKAMVEGRLWELNQRLESEGFSPQNLGVFILGGGGGQSGKRQYRQSQVKDFLEDRPDKVNESTLVEIEARDFDRWA
jgi:hypothetical protein